MSKSNSISQSSNGSPGSPLDYGVLSPEETHEDDLVYGEDLNVPGDVANDSERKGKGKAREQIFSPVFPGQIYTLDHSPRLPSMDHAFVEAEAKDAYLSPPLTSISEKFRSGMENLSWVFRRGLGSNLEFEVDLGLESGSEGSSSPVSGVDTEPGGGVVNAIFDEESLDEGESLLSSSAARTVEATSSRRATVGDTTLQDPGPVSAVVRFPSIFMQDMEISTLASSTETGGSTPLAGPSYPLINRDFDAEAEDDAEISRSLGEDLDLLKSSDDRRGRTHRRTDNYAGIGIRHATKRRILRSGRRKVQEKVLCKFCHIFVH